MISFISSFKIINVVDFAKSKKYVPDSKMFLCILVSTVDAAAVNPNGIKTILANDFSTFFIKEKQVFNNDSRSLPKDPSSCTISDIDF